MNLYRCLAISAIVVLVTAFGVRTSGASAFHEESTGITTANPALDVNEDGYVDITDLRLVFANAGPPPHSLQRADVNNDGTVNLLDMALVARKIGQSAPLPLEAMDVERAFPSLSFELPTNLVQPDEGPDNLFVTEQAGIIRVFPNDQQAAQSSVFLDITDQVTSSSEEGLLGLDFDPDYENNGLFYVYYSTSSPRRSVVSRFSVSQDDPEMADPASEFVIMEIDQPFGNHNGGQLAFGPDGYFYIGLGDGGSGGDPLGHGQDPRTLLGSLLRIDVSGVSGDRNYLIPPDNPFVGAPELREEIWAYGLRNPWRFSFDHPTGDEPTGRLWLGDVGQGAWEEVDIVSKGLNYGWNIMEGAHCFSPSFGCDGAGLELPLWEYSHSEGCSITGGYGFRGRGMPTLVEAYVYGDFCSGKIWGLRYDGESVTEQLLLNDSALNISSFGRDLAGNLYILSYSDGSIYRLVPVE